MTDIQVKYWDLQETKRANRARESETYRHNSATEVQARNELAETIRSHKTVETETQRHDLATEQLTASDLQERARHNRVTEQLDATRIQEQARHNRASESVDRMNAETNRIRANNETTRVAQEMIRLHDDLKTAVADRRFTEAKTIAQEMENEIKKSNFDMHQFRDRYEWIIDDVVNVLKSENATSTLASAITMLFA